MKIVFMGTPDFATGALENLIEAGHEVVLVVTQPDKPKGRGKEVQMTPVKECALRHGIPVFQPVKIKRPEEVEYLRKFSADVFVVAAFGQILSKEILDMPPKGCINIHASLLPKYRGSAPIQWAIINGETESGVTIMQMDVGVDTGDMLLKQSVEILPKDTGDSLHDKLSVAGAKLIVVALEQLEKGMLRPIAQDDSQTCMAPMLNKSLGKMDWKRDAVSLERLVRGLNSWPGTYTNWNGKMLKIWEAELVPIEACGEPGTVASVTKNSIQVNTGKGVLSLITVQPEGKKKLSVHDFLLGNKVEAGMRFL